MRKTSEVLGRHAELVVLLIATVVFLSAIVSPPSLMDDVDALQAQMASNMYHSGHWVTARMDGVLYFEQAPFKYWVTVNSITCLACTIGSRASRPHSAILLTWLVMRFGRWQSAEAGIYSGLVIPLVSGCSYSLASLFRRMLTS